MDNLKIKELKDKKTARKYIKQLINNINPDSREKKASQVWDRVSLHPRFRNAKVVMTYWSFGDELPSHDFVLNWSFQKIILLPRIDGDNIVPVRFMGMEYMSIANKYGIIEPVGDPWQDYDKIDLVLVPALAYDHNGHRLGRGKGYYDRFLKKLNAYTIGIAFEEQILDYIPYDDNDVKINEVIFY